MSFHRRYVSPFRPRKLRSLPSHVSVYLSARQQTRDVANNSCTSQEVIYQFYHPLWTERAEEVPLVLARPSRHHAVKIRWQPPSCQWVCAGRLVCGGLSAASHPQWGSSLGNDRGRQGAKLPPASGAPRLPCVPSDRSSLRMLLISQFPLRRGQANHPSLGGGARCGV